MKQEKTQEETFLKEEVQTGAQVLMRLAGALAVIIGIIVAWKFIFG